MPSSDEKVQILDDAGNLISATHPFPVSGSFSLGTSDAEIGAVEIKDGTTDQRATVNASGEQLVKDGGGLGGLTEAAPASDTASSGINGRLQRIAQRLTSLIALLPASLGQKARASALAVTLSTEDMTALTPATITAGTGTKSNVASDSTQSVTILAANSSRKRWSVYNDSTAILYLDTTGGTASSTSYVVQVPAGGYFEGPLPVNTGLITGRWAATNGNARVGEFA